MLPVGSTGSHSGYSDDSNRQSFLPGQLAQERSEMLGFDVFSLVVLLGFISLATAVLGSIYAVVALICRSKDGVKYGLGFLASGMIGCTIALGIIAIQLLFVLLSPAMR